MSLNYNPTRPALFALAGAALLMGTLCPPARTQAPAPPQDGGMMPPPPMDGGGPMGEGRGPMDSGMRPMGRPRPQTVKSVDAAAKTLVVSSPRGDGDCTVHVTEATQIRTMKTIRVSDLTVGETVMVHGDPSGPSAPTLVVGDLPAGPPPMPQDGPPMDGGGRRGPGGPDGPRGMPGLRGKITATHPLTLALGNGSTLTLSLAQDAKVRKITTETLGEIKAGDKIMVRGRPDEDGVLTADALDVNMMKPGRP